MKAMIVAGARPNFMKVAPIYRALVAAGDVATLVHTGQHYDAQMSEAFFRDLGIPQPAFSLEVGSGTHAVQTARIMERFEPVLLQEKPDWVVVVGDVNSTLACALVAAKLRHDIGCRIAHVEAGLRSFDWRMPEEVNRVLTDTLADLLLTPSPEAKLNLQREGISADRIEFVGNVMIDTLLSLLPMARERSRSSGTAPTGRYAVVTLHRPSNVNDPATLKAILDGIVRFSAEMPVVFPVHPRTKSSLQLQEMPASIQVIEPLGYIDMLGLIDGAAAVLTDSGGLQEETTVLGIPCLTLRESTERPVTVELGTNRLVEWPPTSDAVYRAALQAASEPRTSVGARAPEGWDGHAATRIASALRAVSNVRQ